MRKITKQLLLIAGSALLLAGCAREDLTNQLGDGQPTQVTLTASIPSEMTTKAVADNDGAGASVNRCIMEIYYGDELFSRQYSAVSNKTASFTTTVVSNREYTVAFWADHVADATSATGLAKDSFYTTDATGGLKAVALRGTYLSSDDKRDAFCYSGKYTIAQGGTTCTATLKRPFAQINVITTDVATVKTVSSLKPDSVNLTIKSAVSSYNVLDSTAVTNATNDLTYTAKVYNWDSSKSECTLSMDYIFAEKTKGVIDIAWAAKHGTDANVTHDFTNIPYQRNYRTNIKGALLTTTGQWNVTVDYAWNQPDEDVVFKVVNDIASANDVVAANTDKKEINVTFSSQPSDAGDPTTEGKNAIVTSLLADGATYNIDVASSQETLYVGDYSYDSTGNTVNYNYARIIPANNDSTHTASVNLVVTSGMSIKKLVVNSPSKTVRVNGQTLESGKAYKIENLTVEEVSMNTVIIEKDMIVDKLEMKKGGLEIHGTVNSVEVASGATTSDIKVRACEGLSQSVYNVLKEYIDTPDYAGTKNAADTTKRDIVPTICKIGETHYATLADAFNSVADNGTAEIVMKTNTSITFNAASYVEVKSGQTITLDLNGCKIVSGTSLSSASQLIYNKGTLTIKDSQTGGAIEHSASNPWQLSSGVQNSYVSNVITNSGTLNLESGTVKNNSNGNAAYIADLSGSSTATVTAGTYTATMSAFRLFGGTVTMNVSGGTINSGLYNIVQFSGGSNSNHLNISGGNFNTDEWKNVACTGQGISSNTDGNETSLKITGGTFNHCVVIDQYFNQKNLEISGGSFEFAASKIGTTKFIKGGLFAKNSYEYSSTTLQLSYFVVDDYEVGENTDAATKAQYPWKVQHNPVVKIGDVQYYTLADAIAAVPTDGTQTTITMIADATVEPANADQTGYGINIAVTQNVILDLAGHTISGTSTTGTKSGAGNNYSMIQNNGTLEIKDSGNGGKITYEYLGDTPNYGWFTNTVTNSVTGSGSGDATLTVTNGIIENNTKVDKNIAYAIDNITNTGAQKATLNIKAGTFKSPSGDAVIRMFMNSQTGANTVTIEDGTFEGFVFFVQNPVTGNGEQNGTLTIKGGTYTCNSSNKWLDLGGSTAENFNKVKVNILGGKFTGNMKIRSNVPNSGKDAVVISGGYFSTTALVNENNATRAETLADYVASGYRVDNNTEEATKTAYPYAVVESEFWPDYAAASYASETSNAITINTPEQLALLAKKVNGGTLYSGYTITIDGTFDMSSHYWVPVNAYGKFSGTTIQGANSAIIKTLKINKAVYGGNYDYYAGFIAQSTGELTIKDLTFEGAVSVSNGSGISVVLGLTYGNTTFENVIVKNSRITAATKAGAMLGFTGGDGYKVKFKNCSIDNVTVTSCYSYALFLGLVNTNDSVEFEGCTNTGSNAVYDASLGDYTTYKQIEAGGKTYIYGVSGTNLWITGVNNAWAEIRTNPTPTTTIDQVTYDVKGDKVFLDNGTTPITIVAGSSN